MISQQPRLRILTWHIHGSYLYYLSKGNFEIYLPTSEKKTEGYIGRAETFPFGDNVIEVPEDRIRLLDLDCILFQTPRNYTHDQYKILTDEQRRTTPAVYLEHDPPQEVPTDTRHTVDNKAVTVVHVTHFNRLMWDCGQSPTHVIEHGVIAPRARYTGKHNKGIVIINNLDTRGRRLGLDIFEYVRRHIPLDLVGMGNESLGGLGEVLHPNIPDFIKDYRFAFNPIRYTSLGLAVIEAMMTGLPVVGLATTEMVTTIRHGETGILHTDPDVLIAGMKELLTHPDRAAQLGDAGRRYALDRFNIDRFTADWYDLFETAIRKQRKIALV